MSYKLKLVRENRTAKNRIVLSNVLLFLAFYPLVSGEKSEIPCQSADRFASLRMTVIYKRIEGGR